ncbi:MAG: hypothetical protein JW881_08155 [Spirochaetales bacterium]|nr:hypothetical protein [Spirochaetales bacterium]
MNIIFISYELYFKDVLDYHFKPLGLDIIHKRDPIEVINEIDTLDFDIIIYYEIDYPRHWKPLLKVLREKYPRKKGIFILISDKDFPFEEASKAIFLDINGIVTDNIWNNRVIYRLEEIIRRYLKLPDNRKYSRYPVEESDKIGFIFTHPKILILISGSVIDISADGLRFSPKLPQRIQDLEPGVKLDRCSLLLGDELYTVDCTIIQKNQSIGVQFVYFREVNAKKNPKVRSYLMDERANRKLQHAIARND